MQYKQNLIQRNFMLGKKRNYDLHVKLPINNTPLYIPNIKKEPLNTQGSFINNNLKNLNITIKNNTNINNNSVINNSIKNNSLNNSFFDIKAQSNNHQFDKSMLTKDLLCFYNMSRSVSMSFVKTSKKKYPTNSFIPCLPFP